MKLILDESTTEKGLKKNNPCRVQATEVNQERFFKREPGGARTHDQLVKSQLLYQLSYRFSVYLILGKHQKYTDLSMKINSLDRKNEISFILRVIFDYNEEYSSVPFALNRMPSIFTRIIQGEIPSYKIAENDTHVAFLDIRPVAKGHTLIVPKQEIDKWTDLPTDLLSDTILFAKTVAQHLEHTLKPIRVGLVIEGMEVPHAHIHLIPIYQVGQSMSLSLGAAANQDELAEIATQCSML